MTNETTKLYAERDHESQGEYYFRHVSAMTGERLHEKSAIAGELAHRDMQIDQLAAERDALFRENQLLKDGGRNDYADDMPELESLKASPAGEGISTVEVDQFIEWLNDPNRKSPELSFTSGPARQLADYFRLAFWREGGSVTTEGCPTPEARSGEDGELARKVREWLKLRETVPNQKLYHEDLEALEGILNVPRLMLAIEGADTLQRHAPAIIHAAENEKRLKDAEGLLRESLTNLETNDNGDAVSPKEACYCTDTGCGEFVNGKLEGDLLKCLPCKIRAFLSALASPSSSAGEGGKV